MSRHRYMPEKKVEILRELLENKVSISDLSEKYNIHPNVIGKWKKSLFENAVETFKQKSPRKSNKENKKIKDLEETIQIRDSLIAELVTENIKLKKNLNGKD